MTLKKMFKQYIISKKGMGQHNKSSLSTVIIIHNQYSNNQSIDIINPVYT